MLVLYNAKVHTPGQKRKVTALAIDCGKIIAIGSDDFILAEFRNNAVLQDMQSRVIWAGLIDAHIHMELYGLSQEWINCETPNRSDCIDLVAQKAQVTTPGNWVKGHGWNHNAWPEGLGNATSLDQVASTCPVYLTAKSLHAAWVNSAALQLAGISADTPDPRGGMIQKDDRRQPTGILFDSAMQLVQNVIAPPSDEDIVNAMLKAQSSLYRLGLTGVHDFDGKESFLALQKIQHAGQLKLRVVKAIHIDDLSQAIDESLHKRLGDDHLILGPLKLFADGALGSKTAAMNAPYEDSSGNNGLLMLNADEILQIGKQASANGFNLAVHAIGDLANHVVLDAFEQLRSYERIQKLPNLRHRIEHVQLIAPVDQARMASLGIIASMQPIHAPSDMLIADRYWGSRSQNAYAWKTLQQLGTQIAFGSDAPVESPNPFWGLHAAVTRRRQDGSPGKSGWYPEQRLILSDALKGYTLGASYAAGMEDRIGLLAPGFYADLIVLDRDPFSTSTDEIFLIRPIATMIAGEWVWSSF
jgi:predicted amidohydrolase YtcJ